MNTMTRENGVRELTVDELDHVAGGTSDFIKGLAFYALTLMGSNSGLQPAPVLGGPSGGSGGGCGPNGGGAQPVK